MGFDCEGIPFCGVILRSMQQTTQPLPSFRPSGLRQAIAAVTNSDTKKFPNKPHPPHKPPKPSTQQIERHLWAGIQIFWFGVIRLSRIAPARRRKATVKTGSKPTVTGTHTLPGSTRPQSNIATTTFILESNA